MSEANIIEARLYSLKIQMLVLVFWIDTFLSAVGTNSLEAYVHCGQVMWTATMTTRSMVPEGLLPGLWDLSITTQRANQP